MGGVYRIQTFLDFYIFFIFTRPLTGRITDASTSSWLWGRCGRHNSPPVSSVMDFIFCRSDDSHVPVDTAHPSLRRPSSLSSPRW